MLIKKGVYITIGCISIVCGIVGIFVPGIPTTPFLLLSSWLFYKSSKRMHDALHRSKWLGAYIRRYEQRQGVGWKSKAVSITLMWSMILFSAFVLLEGCHLRILLIVLGIIGTCCVLFVVPNAKKNNAPGSQDRVS